MKLKEVSITRVRKVGGEMESKKGGGRGLGVAGRDHDPKYHMQENNKDPGTIACQSMNG